MLKPTPHSAAHEALIASFEAEGWPREDAEFKAFRFRKCYPRLTRDELVASRDAILKRILAERAEADAKADAQWEAAAPARKAVAA